jgi:hypothetical protein
MEIKDTAKYDKMFEIFTWIYSNYMKDDLKSFYKNIVTEKGYIIFNEKQENIKNKIDEYFNKNKEEIKEKIEEDIEKKTDGDCFSRYNTYNLYHKDQRIDFQIYNEKDGSDEHGYVSYVCFDHPESYEYFDYVRENETEYSNVYVINYFYKDSKKCFEYAKEELKKRNIDVTDEEIKKNIQYIYAIFETKYEEIFDEIIKEKEIEIENIDLEKEYEDDKYSDYL